jgi:hypothetical protein
MFAEDDGLGHETLEVPPDVAGRVGAFVNR